MKKVPTKRFERSLGKLVHNGFDKTLLRSAILWIEAGKQPPTPRYKDHILTGDMKGCWDLHIKPDLVLIYKIIGDELHLLSIGTHNQVFSK